MVYNRLWQLQLLNNNLSAAGRRDWCGNVEKVEWLAKIVAAGLIVSFLSIWTTGYIVTSYVETILKQFNLPLEVPPMAMSGVWGKLWGADPLVTTDIADKEEKKTIVDGEDTPATDAGENEQADPPQPSTPLAKQRMLRLPIWALAGAPKQEVEQNLKMAVLKREQQVLMIPRQR